ncbi:hypothetical protein BWI17_17510 [Betaproteobacteria bacterium GR16-43]|nr:hypothetical protein BWI17_17510 [Betaproteobacteria bacterium GR16-43]
MPRKKAASTRKEKITPTVLVRRALFFVLGSLLTGFLTVVLEAMLREFMPRHFSVSLAVGLAVAATFWLLRFLKHPPMFLKNVHPLAAGLCAGLGVHIARTWLR